VTCRKPTATLEKAELRLLEEIRMTGLDPFCTPAAIERDAARAPCQIN